MNNKDFEFTQMKQLDVTSSISELPGFLFLSNWFELIIQMLTLYLGWDNRLTQNIL